MAGNSPNQGHDVALVDALREYSATARALIPVLRDNNRLTRAGLQQVYTLKDLEKTYRMTAAEVVAVLAAAGLRVDENPGALRVSLDDKLRVDELLREKAAGL